MKYTDTLVSILVPICNAQRYVELSLQSLLKQTYAHIEIIAIDDDSRDESYKILISLAKTDKRLKIFRNKKRYGLGISLNRAVKQARGRYIAFANPNDLSSLHRIKRQVSFLLQNPDVVAVGTQRVLLSDMNKRLERSSFPIEHEAIYPTLVGGNPVQFESVMLNRALLPKDIIKFTSHKYPLVFSELFVKLIQYGEIANINQHLYFHRLVKPLRMRLKQNMIERNVSVAKLWLKSVAVYDYRPSVKAIVQPLISPNKSLTE